MPFSIRPLPASEAAVLLPLLSHVQDIHVAAQPDRYTPSPDPDTVLDWLTQWIASEGMTVLVARTPGIVGYLIYEVERHPTSPMTPDRHRAMLHHISVDPGHQRQGIAQSLIAEMRRRLKAEGVPMIGVTYGTFNHASAALMAREGLVPVVTYAEGPV